MQIRWRLTLWFVLILCVILSLSAVVLYALVQRHFSHQVDDALRVYAAVVHGTLDPERMPEPHDYAVIHSSLPQVDDLASPGVYAQIVNAAGEIIAKSLSLGNQELPYSATLLHDGFVGKVAFETVATGDGTGVRIMVSPLYLTDETLLLEVAQSLTPIEKTMSQLRLSLLGSILVALGLATGLGVITVRSALAPVAQITRTARSIEASRDLSGRVGYRGPPDEIGQLATTFDHMIERLDAAFQSQKDFVADASHELRGPLTIIRGNLDLMKRRISPEDRRESLEALDTETTRMVSIANDLLLLADIDSQQLDMQQQVSLGDVLDHEEARVRPLAGERRLVFDKAEDVSVTGNAHLLQQLLSNLVNNAINYTPADGAITVSLYRAGEGVCIAVADTGVGIPPEHLAHVFERFYRVDKARSRMSGGTGLGLAIVQKIAELHQGRVTVDSEPGRGSRFTLWLST